MSYEPYILYIEDERPTINLVTQVLKLSGYEVLGVTSGRDGLALMRGQKPSLLLLDLMMPGTSGFDVYTQMKDDPILADIPVIVVSAYIPDISYEVIENYPPADDYITKPFNLDQLLRSVKRILDAQITIA